MKKYVILGTSVYGIENMGDETLLNFLIRELRSRDPECEITWVARHKNDELGRLYKVNEVILGLEHDSKEASEGRWFNGLNFGDDTSHLQYLANKIKEADAFIIGGDPFQEITLSFNRGLAPYTANMITLAKFLGTPTVLYSIHMADLKSDYAKELTKFCIENASLTTLREQFSKDVLDDMGINTANCVVTADSAWSLDVQDKTDQIFSKVPFLKENENEKILGINIRHNYWNWSKRKWSKIKGEIAQFLDEAIQTYNCKVLFVPNCTYDIDHAMEDDRPPQREIFDLMKSKKDCFLIEEKLNLWETLSIFPHLWMHASNRRHSAIFSTVHKIPTLPLGGAWHVRPAFEEVDLGINFIEPEFFTKHNLTYSFNDLVNKRDHIIKVLDQKLPELKQLADHQADLISKL